MATAFTGSQKTAYYYQYSVPFAAHRADVTAYVGPATPNQGPEFTLAMRSKYILYRVVTSLIGASANMRIQKSGVTSS